MFNLLTKVLIIFLLCINNIVVAGYIKYTDETNYFLKFSIDNNLPLSQDAATDIAYSSLQALSYLNITKNLEDILSSNKILMFSTSFIINELSTRFIATYNHEVTGHAFRVLEFGLDLKDVNVNFLGGGDTQYKLPCNKTFHIQKQAIIAIAGYEANYLLGQKIRDNLIKNNQTLDPIIAFGYLFSQGNQLDYILASLSSYSEGNDLKGYEEAMQSLYGAKSLTYKDIAMVGWIDLLDPVMLASIYSVATGKNVEVPKFYINENISITPFAKTILTPYSIIEKKIGSYIFTPLSPIKLSFSFGSQSKTKEVYENKRYNQFSGKFTGLKEGETIKNLLSCGIELSISKLIQTKKYNLGVGLALWSQPELLLEDAYRAKAKNGFMVSLNNSYKIKEDVNFTQKITYKTKGFLSGHKIDQDFSFSVGFEIKL